jgi:hypothetical protein
VRHARGGREATGGTRVGKSRGLTVIHADARSPTDTLGSTGDEGGRREAETSRWRRKRRVGREVVTVNASLQTDYHLLSNPTSARRSTPLFCNAALPRHISCLLENAICIIRRSQFTAFPRCWIRLIQPSLRDIAKTTTQKTHRRSWSASLTRSRIVISPSRTQTRGS